MHSMRLVEKAKEEHIAALCGDFGVALLGTKQELAERLAMQLHYETDNEDDDGDGGENEGENEGDDEGDDNKE